jgi:hypothetical protein
VPNLAALPHPSTRAKRPLIRRVPVVPWRIRRGKRARLRLTMSAPARLNIVVQRRVRGHALERGCYRVSVVVIDAAGNRSATVRRPLGVRTRAR